MHIAESRIVGLNVAHDGSDRVDVMIDRVLVSPNAARRLAVGDKVSLSLTDDGAAAQETRKIVAGADLWANQTASQAAAEADAYNLRARPGWLPDDAVRPEAPAFQPATDHEIGVGYLKGLTYQYAYPKGATPADACRWSHIDETEVREELWDIQPGDIVYDIGSAFGSYALCALAMGAARVVCFNPNPQEQDLLMASARLNGWGDKVTRHNVGLWSESGYLNDEEQTFTKTKGDFKVTKTADGRHTQLFEVRTLDSMKLLPWPGRAVAKLDVEAAEAHVLRGARAFFAQVQPAFVLIEVHVFKSTTIEQETDAAMGDLGYVPVTKRPYHSVMHALYRMKGWDD
jgi:FkbM family methyltransferase